MKTYTLVILFILGSNILISQNSRLAKFRADQADVEYSNNDTNSAIAYVREALDFELNFTVPDTSFLIEAYYNLAILNSELKEYTIANGFYEQALLLSKKSNDLLNVTQILRLIGNNCKYENFNNRAKECYSEAMKYALLIDNSKEKSIIQNEIGLMEYQNGNYDSAIESYMEAIRYLNNSEDECERIITYYENIANTYLEIDDYTNTINYYQEALKLSQNRCNNIGLIKLLENIGASYSLINNFDKAVYYYGLALIEGRRINDTILNAEVCSYLGDAYNQLEEIDSAKYYYGQAIFYNRKISNTFGMYSCYTKIGNILSSNNKYTDAIIYHDSAYIQARLLDDKYYRATTKYDIGYLYYLKEEYSNAEDNYLLALEFLPSIEKNTTEYILICWNLGLIYFITEDYPKAIFNYNLAFQFIRENNIDLPTINLLTDIGNAYELNGEIENAIKYYKEAISQCDKGNPNLQQAELYTYLGNSYFFNKNLKVALDYYNKAIIIYRLFNQSNDIIKCQSKINRLNFELRDHSKNK